MSAEMRRLQKSGIRTRIGQAYTVTPQHELRIQSLQERIEREHPSRTLQNGCRHPELLTPFDLCMRVFELCRSFLRPFSLGDSRDCRDGEVADSICAHLVREDLLQNAKDRSRSI